MSISYLTIEKINELNRKYNKREIRSNLLHVFKIYENENNNNMISFQKDVFHEGQYNKNIEYLNKINNTHEDFFENTIISNSDNLQSIFKSTEKLISSLTLEKKLLQNFSLTEDIGFSFSNYSVIESLYSNGGLNILDSFDQIEDYISGHFLFNARLLSFSLNEIIDNNNFKYINTFFENSSENYTLIKNEIKDRIDKKSFRLKNILGIKEENSNSPITSQINEYFKNYMSFPYLLDEQKKIKNFKKNTLSLSMLSQSIINLIDQEDFISNNSLYYGLYPVGLLEKEYLNVEDMTNFSFVKLNEILPLKYLEENSQNEIIQNEKFENFKIESFKKRLDRQSNFLSTNERNIDISNNNFFYNNYETNGLFQFLNCEDIQSFSSFSKVFLEGNSQKQKRYSRNLNTTITNKFNIFSKMADTSYLENDLDNNERTDTLLNENNFASSRQKEKFINHSLNLIELISSCIDNNSMHVIELYQKSSDAINSVNLFQNLNINPSMNTTIIVPATNDFPVNRNVELTTETTFSNKSNTRYRKKENLFLDKTGIHNISLFNEEIDFKNSILRTRKKVDYIVKEIKKYQTGLDFKGIFLKNDSEFQSKPSLSIEQNQNGFIVNKFAYTFENIKKDYIFLGEPGNESNINLIEENLTFLEKKENNLSSISDVFTDLDIEENTIINQSIFKNESSLNNLFSKKNSKNDFKHFVSSTSLFEFITNFCRNFIENNLIDDDHKTNFSNRSNITEAATLLSLYNNFSKGLNNNEKSRLKNIINDTVAKKIINYAKGLPLSNISASIVSERDKIFESIKDNIEYLSNINPFYLFGENLKENMDYDQYDPYENSENLYEQNGLFYHFLFSNYHQEKYFRYRKLNNLTYQIEEFINSSNINENNRSPFFFSYNSNDKFNSDNKRKFSIKNVFNSGVFDFYSKDKRKINLFKPRIKMTKYNEKTSFIITHESDYSDKFNEIKSYITSYFENFENNKVAIRQKIKSKRYGDIYENLIFPDPLLPSIKETDSLIQEKNILNVATPTTSFFENTNGFTDFLDNIAFEMFNIDYVKSLIRNNSLTEENLKKIIDSTFAICSEIFLKMYFELQNYTAICNRIFDSSIFSKGSSKNLTREFILEEDEDINKFIDNLENVRSFYNLYKKFIDSQEYVKSLDNQFYLNVSSVTQTYTPNHIQFSLEEETRHLTDKSLFKKKPSHLKFFYMLKNIFKIRDRDLEKIALYFFGNSEFYSKFHYVFDVFNLHKIKSQNYFENILKIENTGKFDPAFDPEKDQKMQNQNLKIMNFINDSNCMFFDFLFESNMSTQLFFSNLPTVVNAFGGNIFKQNGSGEINSTLNFINNNLRYNSHYFDYLDKYEKLFEIFSVVMPNDKFSYIESMNIQNYISLKDIFQNIISTSYEKNYAYNVKEKKEGSKKTIQSGCNVIEDISSNFLNYSTLNKRNILFQKDDQLSRLSFQNYINSFRLNKKSFVDIQHNWYNHVLRGLLLNDFSYAMNMEIISYFNSYSGIGKDIQSSYDHVLRYRRSNTGDQYFNISSINAKNELKQKTGFSNFNLKNNNFKLKDIYIKQFLKTKISRNIKTKYMLEEKNIESTIGFIKDDIFKNYLKDFYIDKHIQRNSITRSIRIPGSGNKYSNSAANLENSTILSIGIEKDVEIKKNDIILATVEMIDHDYPDLIWEKKIFEFDSSINNPVDDIFTFKNQNERQDNADISFTLNQLVDFINFPLTDYFPAFYNENDNEKDSKKILNYLVSEGGRNYYNFSGNNIGSISAADSYPDVYIESNLTSNMYDLWQKRVNSLKEIYSSRLNLLGISDESFKTKSLQGMIARSIFNQLNSFRLEKILKFLTGFEGKTNFSIQKQDEKFLQGCYILNEVYDLFTLQIFNSANIENLGFTNEELTNSVSIDGLGVFENNVNYKGYNFKLANMTTNHNLNIFLKFMHNFTKAITPDFSDFADSNFSRILNIAIKPEEFIVTILKNQNIVIPAINSYPNLIFDKITDIPINDPIYDEIKTEYNSVIKKMYSLQGITLENNQVSIINERREKVRYIPKNVSYRIRLDLLEY